MKKRVPADDESWNSYTESKLAYLYGLSGEYEKAHEKTSKSYWETRDLTKRKTLELVIRDQTQKLKENHRFLNFILK